MLARDVQDVYDAALTGTYLVSKHAMRLAFVVLPKILSNPCGISVQFFSGSFLGHLPCRRSLVQAM